MRHRTLLLFLLSVLLAAGPYLSSGRRQANCLPAPAPVTPNSLPTDNSVSDASPCGDQQPAVPGMMQALTVLAAIAFAGFVVSLVQSVRQRQAERNLLVAAGVPVKEEDLPLE